MPSHAFTSMRFAKMPSPQTREPRDPGGVVPAACTGFTFAKTTTPSMIASGTINGKYAQREILRLDDGRLAERRRAM